MYNYINIKNKDNNKSNSFFGKWKKCDAQECVSKDIIWLSDEGMSIRRNFEHMDNCFFIKKSFYHVQQKVQIDENKLINHIEKENCDYYFIKTGDDMSYFIRINKLLLLDDEQKNNNLIMFNLYNYIYQHNLISNTQHDDVNFNLVNVKNKMLNIKIYFNDYCYFDDKIKNLSEISVHWVWFRKNNRKLTREISERALSWIIINPKSEFHLWTNLNDEFEFKEFISELEDYMQKIFISKITVHYNDETVCLYNEFMQEYEMSNYYDRESCELMNSEFSSHFKNSLIFKTDIVRLMILYMKGGVYVDFNDCLCMSPIKYVFLSHNLDLPIGVSDKNDLNHASNYFLYSPQKCKLWQNWTFEMIKNCKYIIQFLHNDIMKNEIKSLCLAFAEKLKVDGNSVIDDGEYNNLNDTYIKIYSAIPYLGNKPKTITLTHWKILIHTIIRDLLLDENSKYTIDILMTDIKKTKRGQNNNKATKSYSKIIFDDSNFYGNFDAIYGFWWTDYSLNTTMHFTNLPIFCRMMKYDLYLLPFGYYTRFGCLLSYVCHLGDGGSYGFENKNKMTARILYE
jgi:hypothetical protein